jgi:hypothetical protein
MSDVPENELFSAYLDGELTAEEQADMEKLLAESPRARQLMEEMRALSSTLQSLPVHRLEENLSERILRQAERRMLSEPPSSPDGAPIVSQAGSAMEPTPGLLRRLLRPRNLVWPVIAVAVALMIWTRERGDEPRLAELDFETAPEAALDARGEMDDAMTAAGDVAVESLAEQPVAAAAGEESREEAVGFGVSGGAGGFGGGMVRSLADLDVESELPEAAKKALALEPAAAEPSAPSLAKEAAMADEMDQLAATPAPASRGTAAAPSGTELATRGALGGVTVGDKVGEGEMPEPGAQPESPTEAPVENFTDRLAYRAGQPALTLVCQVSAQAAMGRSFDSVLAKHGVSRIKTDRAPALQVEEPSRAALLRSKPSRRSAGWENLAYVDVEATPAQIQAVLADMESRPKEFFAVLPVAASEESFRNFYAYGLQTREQGVALRTALGRAFELGQTQAAQQGLLEGADEAVHEWLRVRAGKGQVPSGPDADGVVRSRFRRDASERDASAGMYGALQLEAKAERPQPKAPAGEAPFDAAEGLVAAGQSTQEKGLEEGVAPSEVNRKADKKKGGTAEGQELAEEARELGRKHLVRFVLQIGRPDVPVAADVAAEEPPAAAAPVVEQAAPAAEMPAEEAAPAVAPPAPTEPAEGEP